MVNIKLTPTNLAYIELKPLEGTRVYLREPPEKEPQHNTWELHPEPYWLEHVGKRKARVRGSYSPRSEAISVSNKRIVLQEEWDIATDKWAKEKMWKALTKV